MNLKCSHRKGLSVVEVLAIIATLFIVAILFLRLTSLSHNPRTKAPGIYCVSNLKQLGLAARLYSNDHDDRFPWMVSTNFNPANTSGSREFTNSPQVFRHFLAMSNELVSPKILTCPSDEKRTRANDFASLSNSNLSYFVSLEKVNDEVNPNDLFSGDRNITGGSPSNGFLRVFTPKSVVGWTAELHNRVGNVGLCDGSVQQVNVQRLQSHVSAQTNNFRLAVP